MSSTWGEQIKVQIFGESHGTAIGAVIDGLPVGEAIDLDAVQVQMNRRAPGNDPTATQRRETDVPQILSGLLEGHTTGAPLAAIIPNTDTRSKDYRNLLTLPRPSHADYTGYIRYGGFADVRGGGHFSGRLTAPLVFAGAICRQILARRGATIGGHVYAIADEYDTPFDPVLVAAEELDRLAQVPFSVLDETARERMRTKVEQARLEQDSVGGIVECAVAGLPPGLGSPLFGGVENRIASIIFGIPAVRGIEFGTGFEAATLRGSVHNDPFFAEVGTIRTKTNHHGGALGGITSGMPLLFRVAFKPTPSISREQETVDLHSGKPAPLVIRGRHDPCIVPRALPVVEAVTAIALLDLFESQHKAGEYDAT